MPKAPTSYFLKRMAIEKAIAAERATRAALAAEHSDDNQASDIEGLRLLFKRTGGLEGSWHESWGYTNEKEQRLAKFSGVRVSDDGEHVVDLMLSSNGLNNEPSLNLDGNDYGAGMNLLVFLESLNLRGNRLAGSLEDACGSACTLSRSDQFHKRTHHFRNLRNLDFSRNQYTGSFPRILCEIPTLEWLDISRNELGGEVPQTISKLTNLKLLNVSWNNLSWKIPSRGLRTLGRLQGLNVANNNLTSKLSDDVSRLTSLVVLNCSNNRLTGNLPVLTNLLNLKRFCIAGNTLTGPLGEDTLMGLSSLTRLDLSANCFTGPLPESISELINLRWLSLAQNSLTGLFPYDVLLALAEKPNLRTVDFSANSQMIFSKEEVRTIRKAYPPSFELILDEEPEVISEAPEPDQ